MQTSRLYVVAPVTLTLIRRPSHTNLTCSPCRYTGYANMNFLRQGFQKLRTDKTEIIYHAASRVVNNNHYFEIYKTPEWWLIAGELSSLSTFIRLRINHFISVDCHLPTRDDVV